MNCWRVSIEFSLESLILNNSVKVPLLGKHVIKKFTWTPTKQMESSSELSGLIQDPFPIIWSVLCSFMLLAQTSKFNFGNFRAREEYKALHWLDQYKDLWPREPPTVTQNLWGHLHPPAPCLQNTNHIIEKGTWIRPKSSAEFSVYVGGV